MPITHHPPDDTVLRYANGTLPEAPAIVVATHLSFCADCRVRMQTYEMLGGSVLEDVAPLALSANALSTVLARVDTVTDASEGSASVGSARPLPASSGASHRRSPARHRPDLPTGMDWPTPLRHYDIPNWRFVLPGVKWTTLSMTGPESGQLLLVRGVPGARLPSHGHEGTEYTCVLTGAFSDSEGTYRAGDLIEAGEHRDHQPIVTPDAECICAIALEGHLRLHGLARLLQPFLGL